MKIKLISAVALLALFACWACGNKGATAISNQPANASQSATGELRFKAPDGWTTEKPSSNMRAAQYKLPKAEGDNEDASLVLYYFGSNQGGTAQANIDRWISQMQQPDGSDSKSKAKTDTLTVNGLKVTTVDVTGTYTAEMAPGSKTFHNDDNYRLRAAVIETPKGNYYVKLTGPAKTIARWEQSYNDYLKSFEFK
jgi:predicted small lipoprotein YifL